jgi:hypothetical protein
MPFSGLVLAEPSTAAPGTSVEQCAARARPLVYSDATLTTAAKELHPELVQGLSAPSIMSRKWTRRFVAEAFLFSTGSLGDPFSDLPDGAYDVARQFTRWHYDGDGDRPTYEDFSRAWRSLGDSLLSSAAIPDEELGNCALVVLRAAFRSDPYTAGELYADNFAPNYDRSAESGLRQLLRRQTTSFLATHGETASEGVLRNLFEVVAP